MYALTCFTPGRAVIFSVRGEPDRCWTSASTLPPMFVVNRSGAVAVRRAPAVTVTTTATRRAAATATASVAPTRRRNFSRTRNRMALTATIRRASRLRVHPEGSVSIFVAAPVSGCSSPRVASSPDAPTRAIFESMTSATGAEQAPRGTGGNPCTELRPATALDVEAIALLHADSWRRNYRGAYSDEYLDGDVEADRRRVWTERLHDPRPELHTIVALVDGEVVGFVHLVRDADPTWGALVDNLHVAHRRKGQGIGSALMGAAAQALLAEQPSSPVYLWVLEQNTAAQSFYEARGGVRVGRDVVDPPGGGERSFKFRYAWTDAEALIGRVR
ncbi:MAG TPA: GNAT family N-acetyltransferase, partial [Candidatus Elarobacter sp.]|nr:GNAT family N-acetyltransferase [Candidatus Elarobacter sp.]